MQRVMSVEINGPRFLSLTTRLRSSKRDEALPKLLSAALLLCARRARGDARSDRASYEVGTKADEMEQYQGGAPMGYINDVIRKLAAEYQLPWVDFFAATRPLPTLPNPKLPDRPFVQHGLQDEWGYYFHLTEEGRTLKLVCMLQMLDVLTR